MDTAVFDTITFELAVFERHGDEVTVRVRGMSSCADVELQVFDDGRRAAFTPVGSYTADRIREYELADSVDAEPGKTIEVRGLHGAEVVVMEDLAEGYPVVCAADPSVPGLPEQFLHRRGDRYVLMGSGQPVSSPMAHRTTLVA